MTSPVLFEQYPTKHKQFIGIVTLNSEKTLNALNLTMVELMLEQLTQWQKNDDIVAIILQGAGEKAFCAGGDVQALYHSSLDKNNGRCDYAEHFFAQEYRLDYLLHNYSKPTIVWGHGIVMGGGLGLFAACDHKIATEKTRIAMPEVTIGLFPDVGGSYFLNKMPGECGRFLALTGASINATDSKYTGLADYTINHADKTEVLAALQNIDWHLSEHENQLNTLLNQRSTQSIKTMPEGNLPTHQTLINQVCVGDTIDTIDQKIRSMASDDKWLQRAKTGYINGSPLAIKWIFHQLESSKGQSLKTVFQWELRLATNIVRHTEFTEGVRALLIDKDQTPNWQYKTINSIPDSTVEAFFVEPWQQNPLNDL